MYRNYGALLLSFYFLLITLAPTISILTQNDFELIQLIDTSEEEEKNSEKNFEKDVVVFKLQEVFSTYNNVTQGSKVEYKYCDYPIPHLNLISPPPDYFFS